MRNELMLVGAQESRSWKSPVLIEPIPGSGYRASGGPFAIVAEGATAEEALAQFKERVSAKLHNGAKIASVTVQPNEHPWLEFAGMYDPADPIVQEWRAIIKSFLTKRPRKGGQAQFAPRTPQIEPVPGRFVRTL